MFIPCVVIVGEYFTSKCAIAIPLSNCRVGVLCLFLPPMLRFLITYYGWRGCLIVSAGIALNGVILGVLFRLLHKVNITTESHFDIMLLKSPVFWLFFIDQMLWNMGSFILIVLIVDYAKESGINKDLGALLLTVVGISGTIGRIITTILARCVNRLCLYTWATILSGIGIALVPMLASTGYLAFIFSCCAYGICFGFQAGLLGILTADLFSVEHLNSAYGYLIAGNGIGAFLGPPIAGEIFMKRNQSCYKGALIQLFQRSLIFMYIYDTD